MTLSVSFGDISVNGMAKQLNVEVKITSSWDSTNQYATTVNLEASDSPISSDDQVVSGSIDAGETVTRNLTFDIIGAEDADEVRLGATVVLGSEESGVFQDQVTADVPINVSPDLSVELTEIRIIESSSNLEAYFEISNSGNTSASYWLDANFTPGTSNTSLYAQQRDRTGNLSAGESVTEEATFQIAGAEAGDTAGINGILSKGVSDSGDVVDSVDLTGVSLVEDNTNPGDGGDGGGGDGGGGDGGGGEAPPGGVGVSCDIPLETTSGREFPVDLTIVNNDGSAPAQVQIRIAINGSQVDELTELVSANGERSVTTRVTAPQVASDQQADVSVQYSLL